MNLLDGHENFWISFLSLYKLANAYQEAIKIKDPTIVKLRK